MATRREVVTTLGAATLSLASCRTAPAQRVAGSAAKVGIQLYTLRSEMRESVPNTLEAVAGIGYSEVEFAGYFGHSAVDIRAMLDDNGLTAPAAHFGLPELENDWDATLQFAATVGHHYLVVPWIDPADRVSADTYRRVVDRFNVVAERVGAAGMTFGYHNHDFEFEFVDGRLAYDIILEQADPKLVQFELDLFWITKGGSDPFTYFRAFPGRFPMVHVKDMASDGSMADVGAGQIDFASIFAESVRAGIKHYFVEHDNPADPLQSARTSYAHVAALLE